MAKFIKLTGTNHDVLRVWVGPGTLIRPLRSESPSALIGSVIETIGWNIHVYENPDQVLALIAEGDKP